MLCGLVIEPRFGAVVLNGLPGMLQFYQFEQDRQLAEVRGWGTTRRRVHALVFIQSCVPPRIYLYVFAVGSLRWWRATALGAPTTGGPRSHASISPPLACRAAGWRRYAEIDLLHL